MKFTYKILFVFIIMSCSSNDDATTAKEATIIGTWTGASSTLNGEDRGIPSNSIVKFTADNRTEFIYEGYGNNGEDISEYGKWKKSDSKLTITWDEADAGLGTYILNITELSSTSLTWQSAISGEGSLIETFKR
jgi:hypothetical protein